MKKRIAIQGSLFAVAAILCLIAPKLFFPTWDNFLSEEVFDLAGLLLVMFGLMLRISARGYKSEQSNVSHELVTDKIYAFVRNPMYLGSFNIGLGLNMGLFNIWVFICFLGVYLFIYIREVKKEQRILSEQFGQQYTDYCKSVPLFFPKLNNIFNLKKYLILKKAWIKRELNLIISIFSVFVILELWQDVAVFEWGQIMEEVIELGFTALSFILFVKYFMLNEDSKES